MPYEDDAETWVLYTRGKKGNISESLRQLLSYMENTNQNNAINEDLRDIQQMVDQVKRDGEVSLRYMKWFEHDQIDVYKRQPTFWRHFPGRISQTETCGRFLMIRLSGRSRSRRPVTGCWIIQMHRNMGGSGMPWRRPEARRTRSFLTGIGPEKAGPFTVRTRWSSWRR